MTTSSRSRFRRLSIAMVAAFRKLAHPVLYSVFNERLQRRQGAVPKTRQVKHRAATARRMGANSLSHAKSYFGEFFGVCGPSSALPR